MNDSGKTILPMSAKCKICTLLNFRGVTKMIGMLQSNKFALRFDSKSSFLPVFSRFIIKKRFF